MSFGGFEISCFEFLTVRVGGGVFGGVQTGRPEQRLEAGAGRILCEQSVFNVKKTDAKFSPFPYLDRLNAFRYC